jgi:two-component system sensor histidine kinase QseC
MSIRRRLLIGLSAGLLVLFAISGGAFYWYVRTVLTYQFDAALTAKAHAFCSLVRSQPDGGIDLDLPQHATDGPAAAPFEYYQVWRDDGTVSARSPTLGSSDLPHAASLEAPYLTDFRLPDGRAGRVIELRCIATPDQDDAADSGHTDRRAAQSAATTVIVAIAQDRSDLDRVLTVLLTSLLAASVLVIAGTLCIVAVVVRHGLQPLQKVARDAAQIDVQSLTFRFSLDGLPAELLPICRRLNESLDRVQAAFLRERRFSADVAHELRTPIAELRSLADVATKWDGDHETTKDYFHDAREIAQQMEAIVTRLLALARCQAGSIAAAREPVDVAELVRQAWRNCESIAARRELRVQFDLPADIVVTTDRNLLGSIAGNLLANAADYTTEGGSIFCKAKRSGSQWMLIVVNDTDALHEEDLPHLFEPFWRKDTARTDGSHSGLGLSLVDAYVKVLGGKVEVAMPAAGSFCITVCLPDCNASVLSQRKLVAQAT